MTRESVKAAFSGGIIASYLVVKNLLSLICWYYEFRGFIIPHKDSKEKGNIDLSIG